MKFWRIFLVHLLCIFFILSVSCAPKEKASLKEPTLDMIAKRGKLLVGTTGDYRPLTYRDPGTDNYWGFDLEVADQISKRLGVPIFYVQTSWPTLTKDVLNKDLFDLALGGITITDARKNLMDMSEGYLVNGKTILCRKKEVKKYRSLSDLDKPKVRVMVNPGGLNEKFAR
ncbi:MAG: transporter substrate-binding domain-containing protein, partial [Desulfovibrionaceae bacterium]|nr:transporter substrate-binding domain-containing protein [Desulfovibrionaceae bacterium]